MYIVNTYSQNAFIFINNGYTSDKFKFPLDNIKDIILLIKY